MQDRMQPTARSIGARWEDAASRYLQGGGLQLVARNFSCRFGEIDLVLRDGEQIVFAEVRYRDNARHGSGTLTVGPAKQAKLVRAAAFYLQAHAKFAGLPCRFDVIGCSGTPDAPAFEWTRNAFDAF